jgi:hypothetical protein
MKPNHILLIIAGVIILLFTLAGGCAGYHMGKNTCAEIVKSDTVRIVLHDSVMVKEAVKSKPRKVAKAKIASANIDTIHCDTLRLITRELIALADTCFYSDTLRNDTSYSMVVNDTVVGHRLGLGVEFKNLRPLVREVVTNTVLKKPKPQIYAGAVGGVNNSATNFMVGVSGAVGYKAFLGSYTYDFKNQIHQVGGYWRLWGK